MSIPAAKQAIPRAQLVAGLVCAASGLALFQFFGNATRGYVDTPSLFWWWISQWLDPRTETGHGWLVLGIAGWVGWRNLRMADCGLRIADCETEAGGRRLEGGYRISGTGNRIVGSRHVVGNPQSAIRNPQLAAGFFPIAAFVALTSGLLLHALGFVAQQTRVSIVAFLIFTWGVARLVGGRRWGAALLFPLGFMVFAIPVSVLEEIGLPLRLWVTVAGEWIAHLAGIEVVRSGTQLVAPDGRFNYDVAAPCSGVRSLVALLALSVLIGYMNFRSWWKRVAVVTACLPLVYLGNVARIVAIIFAAQWFGPKWGDFAHTVMGYGVFVIVLGGVFAVVAGLRRIGAARSRESARSTRGDARDVAGRSTVAGTRGVIAVAAVVAALAIGEMAALGALAKTAPRGKVGVVLAADGLNPIELPTFLGSDWIGRRTEVSAVERDILPADTGFSRKNYVFVEDRGKDVFLSIVLSGRDRTSIHRPELCLVGQGWTIEGATRHAFRFPGNGNETGREFGATILRVRREVPTPRGKIVVPQLVAYWFVAGDAVVASHWERFLHDTWNRVVHARADRWAYVLMQTNAHDGEAAALARMQQVLDHTLPIFQADVRGD